MHHLALFLCTTISVAASFFFYSPPFGIDVFTNNIVNKICGFACIHTHVCRLKMSPFRLASAHGVEIGSGQRDIGGGGRLEGWPWWV